MLAAVVLLAGCGAAAESGGGRIGVTDARIPVPAGPNGAAYLTLTNDGGTADRLVGVSTDAAETAEIHETSTDRGTMSMQQVEGVDIPAGGSATLEPGGVHIMLIGVTGDLAEGDRVDLTLSFDHAADRTVTAEVVPLTDEPSGDTGGMGDMSEDMSSEG